jgi:uncharacterized membrane protein (UPF0127 family)
MLVFRLLRSRRLLLAVAWVVAAVLALSVALAIALGLSLSPSRGVKAVPSAHAEAVISALNADPSVVRIGANRSAPVAYVFEDPNCVFCAQFDTLAKPLLDAGRIQLRVALVAFVKPSSAGRAAAIWADRDPGVALQRNAEQFSGFTENGGVPPIEASSQDLLRLRAHMNLLRGFGPISTPTLLYQVGSQWRVASGASPSLLNEIATPERVPQAALPSTDLHVGQARIQVEVAKTDKEMQTGLMGRRALPEGHGMLFDFPSGAVQCMWMKDTDIPLSVAFIGANKKILNIAEMSPLSLRSWCSMGPARYAIEAPPEWFAKNGILPGVEVSGL